MKKTILCGIISIVSILSAFETNVILREMNDTTYMDITNSTLFTKNLAANNILDFSGMVYNFHNHRIIAFGGGHATAMFPTNVAEFDFASLKWSFLINIDSAVSCGGLYTASNALFSSTGQKLGGVRYDGKVYAGSRHTYDGLEMASDTNLMLLAQAQEFRGCNINNYDSLFSSGSGLFALDPERKEWTVSENAGLASSYCYSAVNPEEPDHIYMGSAGMGGFYSVNWKTGERTAKSAVSFSAGSDMSMTYCPERKSFFAFPYSSVYEYSISTNTWTKLNPSGTVPNCYSLNVVYDTLNKVFACFYDSSFFYYSPSENMWYRQQTKKYLARLYHHHVYDPVNNVHIMVGAGWNTYAYKFSNTSGLFPGTGGATGAVHNFKERNLTNLSATPNPFAASVIFRYQQFSGSSLKLVITDINGAIVYSKDIVPKASGTFVWNGNRQNGGAAVAGIYLASISDGTSKKVAKIIISR